MRKSVVAAWLALSSIVAAVPAAADGPITLPPLAPGEALLEISAIGVATSPATSATLNVAISVEAPTDAEARSMAGAAIARVEAAARAAGVAAADIETRNVDAMTGPLGNAMYSEMNSTSEDMAYGVATVVIRVRNPAAAPGLQRTLGGLPDVGYVEPEYRLDDDSVARRSARADALRRARADADGYAASMNMRVARVLRVTERVGLDFMSIMSPDNPLVREMEAGRTTNDGQIRVVAVLGVDYALAPR
ncbi:MAG TPA: SIMPL domain-containing protein [Allosphingosinicella sp.]|jgi:hypothetical protein